LKRRFTGIIKAPFNRQEGTFPFFFRFPSLQGEVANYHSLPLFHANFPAEWVRVAWSAQMLFPFASSFPFFPFCKYPPASQTACLHDIAESTLLPSFLVDERIPCRFPFFFLCKICRYSVKRPVLFCSNETPPCSSARPFFPLTFRARTVVEVFWSHKEPLFFMMLAFPPLRH